MRGEAGITSAHGALLIDKPEGISSFGVIEELQKAYRARHGIKRKDLPKYGHGGTLDPFATGLLVVCIGNAVKLSRYFLESTKEYRGEMLFGQTSISGDLTGEISERSTVLPESREAIQELATRLTLQPYLQTPPMHSAKKVDGRPLYELARQGKDIEREPKLCHLSDFVIESYDRTSHLGSARFRVRCSSGTYIRTLAQDLARMLGTVGMLQSLTRTASGQLILGTPETGPALTLQEVNALVSQGKDYTEMRAWVPFDQMLKGRARAQASEEEAIQIFQGKQGVLHSLLRRATNQEGDADPSFLTIYRGEELIAVARMGDAAWELERVFPR